MEKEPFVIRNDQAADWAVRKICEADAELERMEAWYQHQMDAVRKDHDETVSYFTGLLRQYLSQVPAKETKTSIRYALPSGDMVLTKAKDDFACEDEARLLEWCRANDKALVKAAYSPRWADVKKRLALTDAGIVDTETGMLVDGVGVRHTDDEFNVRAKKGE